MAHKREQSLPSNINDYVLMRVYGRKKYYLAQRKKDHLIVCKINPETKEVNWTETTIPYRIIKGVDGCDDRVIVNYGLRNNIDVEELERERPEFFLRLL